MIAKSPDLNMEHYLRAVERHRRLARSALQQGSHPPRATLGARPRRADNCALGRAATRTARADLGRLGLAN